MVRHLLAGGGDPVVGGADLAAAFLRHDPVGAYRMLVHPVRVGSRPGWAPGVWPKARRKTSMKAASPGAPGHEDRRAFLRLSLVVVVRSVAFIGLSTFIALYVRERGGGGTAGALALFALFAGSAGGTLLGGRLAARRGRVATVRRAYAAAAPAVLGVLCLPLPLVYVCAALAAAALYVPFSLQVTLGQDYLPTRMGTASGVTLGLTVSVGGLASPFIGALADATSVRTALLPLAVLPLLAWALARRLPEPVPGA
ncbi:MFS transporter [Streptomyces sp. NBC_01343]|uniref:MFS transporter n=1 Tax=Streptomyces sp. NBC_01343 TaxID=2903832 RepID=UPI003FA354B7